jgi:ribosome-associated translation inhibitor RaiA
VGHVLCDISNGSFCERSGNEMQIRVDTDEHIDSSEELTLRIEGVVEGSLDRYVDRVTLVQVHLGRLTKHSTAGRDMCCRMEAHLGGLKPIAVSHEAFTLTEAIHAASAKLERAIHHEFQQRRTAIPHQGPADDETAADPAASLGHARSS